MKDGAEPTLHNFEAQGLRLSCVEWGDPDADTLVLVHGGFDHARSWDRIARRLARDWRILAPDLRGHGDSAHSPDQAYSVAYYTCDLADFLDRFAPGPATIVAHSLGAAIALHYAGLFPDRVARLVAIEGLGLAPPPGGATPGVSTLPVAERTREWIGGRRRKAGRTSRVYASRAAATERMRERHPFLDVDLAAHLVATGTREDGAGGFVWKYDPLVGPMLPCEYTSEQIREVWRAIECPLLLCCGSESWATNPIDDGRIEHFADARVVSFAGAGRWLHHEQPDAFLTAMSDFLEGEWSE